MSLVDLPAVPAFGAKRQPAIVPPALPLLAPPGSAIDAALLAQMRVDFPLAALDDEWCEAMKTDIAAAVKAHIDAGDSENVRCWAAWLAVRANRWRAFQARVRDAEVRMKDAKARERKDSEDESVRSDL
jgi:hypothetical protein